MLSLLDKFVAVLKRDLLIAVRQRKSFVALAITLFFEVLGLYFLAHAVGPKFRPDGGDYFPFLVVGVALFNFLMAGVDGFISAVHDSQVGGTMEALMNTATPPFIVVLLSAISAFLGRSINLMLYVVVGLAVVQLPTNHPNIVGCFLILILSIACASAFGILAAAVQLWSQRGSAVVWLLGSAFWLLSGTMFPVGTLPYVVRRLAEFLPFTQSLSGLRLALLQGSTMQQLWGPILSLLTFSIVFSPLSIMAFSLALRHARQRGTIGFY